MRAAAGITSPECLHVPAKHILRYILSDLLTSCEDALASAPDVETEAQRDEAVGRRGQGQAGEGQHCYPGRVAQSPWGHAALTPGAAGGGGASAPRLALECVICTPLSLSLFISATLTQLCRGDLWADMEEWAFAGRQWALESRALALVDGFALPSTWV